MALRLVLPSLRQKTGRMEFPGNKRQTASGRTHAGEDNESDFGYSDSEMSVKTPKRKYQICICMKQSGILERAPPPTQGIHLRVIRMEMT